MSKISISRVHRADDRTLPAFLETERVQQLLRERAFALFANRGACDGHALEDWLQAEHEIYPVPVNLTEYDKDCVVEIAVPGCEPSDVEVTVTPREMIVYARARAETNRGAHDKREMTGRWNSFDDTDVCRRIEFGTDINVSRVTAMLKQGTLKVIAPKLKPCRPRARVSKATLEAASEAGR